MSCRSGGVNVHWHIWEHFAQKYSTPDYTGLHSSTLDFLTMGSQKAVIVALSGCSSSGKTTLARLLRDIFPNTFILHEDDFYKPEDE
jgi:ABC-type glutathione transport system ATPase component